MLRRRTLSTVTGDDAEIDYNEFRDKKTLGNMISVTAARAARSRVDFGFTTIIFTTSRTPTATAPRPFASVLAV